jgi:hypothetical protein
VGETTQRIAELLAAAVHSMTAPVRSAQRYTSERSALVAVCV